MRLILLSLVFIAASFHANAAPGERGPSGAGRASIHAILVTASKTGGESDRRLAPYEATLRRILRFESFRFVGEGRAAAAIPGDASLSLGNGQHLELRTEPSTDDRLRMQVRWIEGDRALMSTGLVLRPGVPAVLGGPSRGENNEVYAVIVIAD